MSHTISRREFFLQAAALTAALSLPKIAGAAKTATPALPMISLGKLKVGRMILGSNPFFGYAHVSAKERDEMNSFYTKEKVMDVLDEAFANGVTAVWMPADPRMVNLWTDYKAKSGKLPTWIAQNHVDPAHMKENMTEAVKKGAAAISVQGVAIDRLVRAGKWDTVREWIEHIKSLGVPAGMASHYPDTHLEAERRKIPTDFYCQCLYTPEDYSPDRREAALKTISQIEKPVIAYKVLAAGRLTPDEALNYVIPKLKPKDGLCVGIFSKHDRDQIREDTTLIGMLSEK